MTFLQVNKMLIEGFGKNVLLFAMTLLFAIPLGLLIMLCSRSKFKPLAIFMRTFVWIIRGTPLMLQLFVVFYVPGMLLNVQIFTDRFTAALVAFVINYACYFSEIYRGGFDSVPFGQNEAAQVLGMSRKNTLFYVIIPQVCKRILAPMGNEVITLVKDTSLARVIMVAEIFYVNEISILSKAIVWPLFYIGAFFLAFVGVLTLLLRWLEKKMSYYKI